MSCPAPVCLNLRTCTNTSYGYDCGCLDRRYTTGQFCERCLESMFSHFTEIKAWTISSLTVSFVAIGFLIAVYFWSRTGAAHKFARSLSLLAWETESLFVALGTIMVTLALRGPISFEWSVRHPTANEFPFNVDGNSGCSLNQLLLRMGYSLIVLGLAFNSILTSMGLAEFKASMMKQQLDQFMTKSKGELLSNTLRASKILPTRDTAVIVSAMSIMLIIFSLVLLPVDFLTPRPCCYGGIAYSMGDIIFFAILLLYIVPTVIGSIWTLAIVLGATSRRITFTEYVLRDMIGWSHIDENVAGGVALLSTIFIVRLLLVLFLAVIFVLDLVDAADSLQHGNEKATLSKPWIRAEVILFAFQVWTILRLCFWTYFEDQRIKNIKNIVKTPEIDVSRLSLTLHPNPYSKKEQRSTGDGTSYAFILTDSKSECACTKNHTQDLVDLVHPWLELSDQEHYFMEWYLEHFTHLSYSDYSQLKAVYSHYPLMDSIRRLCEQRVRQLRFRLKLQKDKQNVK